MSKMVFLTEEKAEQIKEALVSMLSYEELDVRDITECRKALALLVPTELPQTDVELVEKIREYVAIMKYFDNHMETTYKLSNTEAAALLTASPSGCR